MRRRLGIKPDEVEGSDDAPVRRALAAGLFPNAVQLAETTYESRDAAFAGTHVYRLLRSSGPGARRAHAHMRAAALLLLRLACCLAVALAVASVSLFLSLVRSCNRGLHPGRVCILPCFLTSHC
jgi:hypothetical protein